MTTAHEMLQESGAGGPMFGSLFVVGGLACVQVVCQLYRIWNEQVVFSDDDDDDDDRMTANDPAFIGARRVCSQSRVCDMFQMFESILISKTSSANTRKRGFPNAARPAFQRRQPIWHRFDDFFVTSLLYMSVIQMAGFFVTFSPPLKPGNPIGDLFPKGQTMQLVEVMLTQFFPIALLMAGPHWTGLGGGEWLFCFFTWCPAP